MTEAPSQAFIRLFLCGDVMTGRGIDQILPHPSFPRIHEPYMRDARGYVELAEDANGPIPRPVSFSYVWGDALAEFERMAPDAKIINLETSVTRSEDYWPGKGINYRMNPDNVPVITTAGIDVCSLANNHVLDWGYAGLEETLRTLQDAGVGSAGAGRDLAEAESPAVVEVEGKGRVLVLSLGTESSGIPEAWAATRERPGVNLTELDEGALRCIGERVQAVKRRGDIVVASIHWGGNWGYEIPKEQREFAHQLVERVGIDVVHGHSSHHVKGIEVYRGRPIIYGCGDFITDYEGIGGYEDFRGDLGLMYFVEMDVVTGTLFSMEMVPTRVRKLRVNRAGRQDVLWLKETLDREGSRLDTRVELTQKNTLVLCWEET